MLSLDRDMSRVRPPAVAGLFYPQDADELRRVVGGYLRSLAGALREARRPKALIVPHAGYPYSGRRRRLRLPAAARLAARRSVTSC